MKVSLPFFLFLLLFASFTVAAQNQETTSTQPKRFYVGVNYTNTQYFLRPRNVAPANVRFNPNFLTYPSIHVGYQLGKRASVQIGMAYAHENTEWGSEYNNAGTIEGNYDTIQTRGAIIPLTFRYNLLNIGQRFHVNGTSTLTAAFGKNTVNQTTTSNEQVTSTSQQTVSAFNMYLSLGLGLNYDVSKRFNVYGDLLLFNRNFNSGYRNPSSTFNVGFNYRFK
ncbi:MAG: outer membrane beta-barrel protein [Adhaeribacter sp.]